MDMQRNRINGERFRLLFARPFEPWAVMTQCRCEDLHLIGGERSPLCLLQQFGEVVGVAVLVESQARWQVRVIGVFLFRFFAGLSHVRRCPQAGCSFGWRRRAGNLQRFVSCFLAGRFVRAISVFPSSKFLGLGICCFPMPSKTRTSNLLFP